MARGRGLRFKTKPKTALSRSGSTDNLKQNKYRNQRVQIDGHWFDSKREADVYLQLRSLERGGAIRDLTLQPRWTFPIGGELLRHRPSTKRLRDGRVVPVAGRPVTYTADFQFIESQGGYLKTRIIDVKGYETDTFKLRWALMKACHGIEVEIWK